MASRSGRLQGRWGFVVLAALAGCATGEQDDTLPGPGVAGETGAGGGGSGGVPSEAGTQSKAGSTSRGGGGSSTGSSGSFTTSGGTFGTAGTFGQSGTATGGTPGASGSGGAGGSAGVGGKGGAGGGGGSGGKGGSGGSGGSAGSAGGQSGGTCAKAELTPTTATASGTSEYPPTNAIDNEVGTRWSGEHGVDTTYLQLDMGEAVSVNRVSIVWEAAYATSYKIQIADNAAGPYTDLYSDTAGNGGTDDVTTPALTLGRGRYVRMQGVSRKTQYGYSIFEMNVYGDKDETCK
jgi:hypothetical protein